MPRSPEEILFRVTLAEKCIEILQTDPDVRDHPNARERVKELQDQIAKMQTELPDELKPQPVAVGLQPARLQGISKNTQEVTNG